MSKRERVRDIALIINVTITYLPCTLIASNYWVIK